MTRGFQLVTRRFELVTHGFKLVTRIFKLITRVSELVTHVFLFHKPHYLKTHLETKTGVSKFHFLFGLVRSYLKRKLRT